MNSPKKVSIKPTVILIFNTTLSLSLCYKFLFCFLLEVVLTMLDGQV